MKWFYEFILTLIFFLSVCFVYKGQPRTVLNEGQGYDGVYYYKIAKQIQQNVKPIEGQTPFIKRIGTAFLIGSYSNITGTNLMDSALVINLSGTLITSLLLLFWLRLFIGIWWIRFLLLCLFILNYQGPLRSSFFYPMASDSWGCVWFIGSLLSLEAIRAAYYDKRAGRGYIILFSIITAIGTLFRESNAIISLAVFFITNPIKITRASLSTTTSLGNAGIFGKIKELFPTVQTLIFYTPILCILFATIVASQFTANVNGQHYFYIIEIIRWLYTKSLAEYLLAILIAYGPLFILIPFFINQYKSFLLERQELLLLLAISFVLGFIGGSDTERILFMTGFPIIFILLGTAIKNIFYSPLRWWFFVLLILQSAAYRLYWPTPDYAVESGHSTLPFFTLWGTHFSVLDLFSHHGNFVINSLLLTEYCSLFVITFFLLRKGNTVRA